MTIEMDRKKFTTAERLVNYLMVKSCSTEDFGLFQGKTGLSIAILSYGRLTQNPVYLDFAFFLMEQSLSQLEKLPIFDFGYGQTGVGWGWEYISAIHPIQKHYTDRLNGLDKNVKENMQQEQSNETLYLLHYVLARMAGCKARSENTLFTVQDVDLLANRADGFSQTDLSPENYRPDITAFMDINAGNCIDMDNVSIRDGLSMMLMRQILPQL